MTTGGPQVIQWRGGPAAESDVFIGRPKEITVNTTAWEMCLHDGITPGGHRLGRSGDAPEHQWVGGELQFKNPDGTWGALISLTTELTTEQIAAIEAKGTSEITRVGTEGGDTQVARVTIEGNTQVARVITEGDTQTARATAEGDAQIIRVQGEGTTQVGLVTAEGTTQTNLVIAQGTSEIARVEAEGGTPQVARVVAEGDTQVARVSAMSNTMVDTRQSVLSFGGGLTAEEVEVKVFDSIDYIGTGVAGLAVDLGMAFSGGEYGGMVMYTDPTRAGDRFVTDTIRGAGHLLVSDSVNSDTVWADKIQEFTSTGFVAGDDIRINSPDGNNVLAFHTTNKVTIDGIEWSFNPATGFAMCKYTGDASPKVIKHPMGTPLIMGWFKQIDASRNWTVYSSVIGASKFLNLNLSNAAAANAAMFDNKDSTDDEIYVGTTNSTNAPGGTIMFYGWFGERLDDITPGMWGKRGVTVTVLLTDGGTFDCGFEPEAIISKMIDGQDSWYVMSKDSNFAKLTKLDSPDAEINQSPSAIPTLNGSEITFPSSWSGERLFMVFGKTGDLPTGKSIQIKATPDKPFVATISDGFNVNNGNKDLIVGKDADAVYPMTWPDGEWDIFAMPDGTLDYGPVGSYTADLGPDWKNTKVLLGKCTVTDGLVVDIDLVATGDTWASPLWPAVPNTTYIIPNMLMSRNVEWALYYSSKPSNDGRLALTGLQTLDAEDPYRVRGGNVYLEENNTFSVRSRDYLTDLGYLTGYYKLVVRRVSNG